MKDVAIIGGGILGLAIGYELNISQTSKSYL
jgi:L-2-hydroxyglutarate oxidase LhgO